MINTYVDPDIKELLGVWPMGWTFGLREHSVCVVAGAYKGRVIDLLYQVYRPRRILGFDPQQWAIKTATERVGHLPEVELYPFAIGLTNGVFPMGETETDGCSFVNAGEGVRQPGFGEMQDIRNFDFGPRVDLAVFNMEGYEFDLLPYMISLGMMKTWDRFAVQFHHGFGNDGNYQSLLKDMARTHEVVIDNAPQWVYWRSKTHQ